MKNDDIYNAWAPADSPWSPWAKPVLFAYLGSGADLPSELHEESRREIVSPEKWKALAMPDGHTAVILDLPDELSVRTGIALAQAGYRPVPVYNSVPASGPGAWTSATQVAVPMARILGEIEASAETLQALGLPPGAPPAFLLDSRRRHSANLLPGAFDNRSISLPTDFPSANFLLANGVQRIVVIIEEGASVQTDLAHTLRRWQQAGLTIFRCWNRDDANLHPVNIARPPYFRHLWYGLLATFGLHRNLLGGFGGFIPLPSTG